MKKSIKLIFLLATAGLLAACSSNNLASTNSIYSNNANLDILNGKKIWTDTDAKIQKFEISFNNPINEYGITLSDFQTIQFYFAVQNGTTATIDTNLKMKPYYDSTLFQLNKNLNLVYNITDSDISTIIISK